MKKIKFLLFVLSLLLILSSCTGIIRTRKMWDYYTEYHFELPFRPSDYAQLGGGGHLWFTADYTMEQMKQFINDMGYVANIYQNGDASTMLISAERDERIYYFVIFDAVYSQGIYRYVLDRASASLMIGVPDPRIPSLYVFLAPIHILREVSEGIYRAYETFEYIADFYLSTGKNDVEIDFDNKTIYFQTAGNQQSRWRQGTIVMQYIETEDGSFLEIRPLELY
ncbi:MAG: hypothetical protein FWE33_07265 [Defluviitaleaceae bacterium]|nr:hypothetical protein [Defluviitaleaceae bacterium]